MLKSHEEKMGPDKKRVDFGHGQRLMRDERLRAAQSACDWRRGDMIHRVANIPIWGVIHLREYRQEISRDWYYAPSQHFWHCSTERSRALKASYKHQFTVCTTQHFYFAFFFFAKAFLFPQCENIILMFSVEDCKWEDEEGFCHFFQVGSHKPG